MTETPKRRFGFKRYIVLALIFGGGYLAYGVGGIFKPVSPAVVLPGEATGLAVAGFPITNTLLATLVADAVLLLMAFGAWRYNAAGKLVPDGFYNFFEMIVEFLWTTTESAAGKWARRLFPWTATIFLLVFAANMTKLVPGYESIGRLEQAHGSAKGYAPAPLFGNVYAIDGSRPVEEEAEGEASAEAGHGAEAEGGAGCTACEVIPFLRGAPTDVNFTFALAVITVVMIQIFGVWALGRRYFVKFVNTGGMISRPFFGVIDFLVGLLETVSEFAKILSFGFRLFGNIFAGALLLSIVGALAPIIIPSTLYALEIFVGLIQAYVFSMLALVFMSQAKVSHHGEEHAAR